MAKRFTTTSDAAGRGRRGDHAAGAGDHVRSPRQVVRAGDADPEALRRLLRRPVAGRRRRSAAQRLRAQHGRRQLRPQVRAGAAGARCRPTSASSRGCRIPTANGGAVPAAGRRDDFHVSSLSPLLSGVRSPPDTRVGGPDVGSARRRGHRRQHAVQVARLPRPGRVVPGRVGAVRPRHDLVQGEPVGRRAAGDPADGQPADGVRRPVQQLHAAQRRRRPPRAGLPAARRKSVLDLVGGNLQKLTRTRSSAPPTSSGCRATSTRSATWSARSPPCRPPARRPARSCPIPGADPAPGGNQGVDAGGDNTYDDQPRLQRRGGAREDLLRPGAHGVDLRPDPRRRRCSSRCSSRT